LTFSQRVNYLSHCTQTTRPSQHCCCVLYTHSESVHTVTNVDEFACSAGQCFKFHADASVITDAFNN